MTIVLWITSKLLRFKKPGFILAVFLSLFYLVIGYVFALIVVERSSYTLVTASAWVLAMKILYRDGWLKTFAATAIAWISSAILIMTVGLLFWLIGASSSM